ncbi:PAS-domain containing protein [Terrarubrum flagellatum]|uniref:PAS-domain containing protein n=1 Tax=Terrirubrum flagellatum TaxID=2895980 RepID=UPI003144E769
MFEPSGADIPSTPAFDIREAAIAAAPDGIWALDDQGRLAFANPLFLEFHDLPAEAAPAGLPWRDLLALIAWRGALDALACEELRRRCEIGFASGAAFDERYALCDGRRILARFRPMARGGWVAVCQDMTEREPPGEELRRKARRFDQILKSMPQGFALYDANETLVIRNDRYLSLYGFDPAIIRPGVSLRDVTDYCVRHGVYQDITADELYRDSHERLYESDSHLRRLADGRCLTVHKHQLPEGGWIIICEDVTSRERAAAELREQHRRFDAALNNMSQGLCMFDAEHRLIVCNERYVSIFRADADVVKPGVTLREIFEHGVARGVYPGLTPDELVKRRLATIAGVGPGSYDQQMADGRIIEVAVSNLADGGWIATFEDVTARRRLEAERAAAVSALQEMNLQLDTTLESMAQGLCVYDSDFRIVIRNQRYLDIYGLDAEMVRPGMALRDVIGQSVARGTHLDGVEAGAIYQEFIASVIDRSEPVFQRRLANGRVVAVRTSPMANGGWVATFEDITDREHAAEALREQHRRFDAALNNMAHGLVMLDEELRLIVCNRRYLEMYRLSPEIVKPGVTMTEIMRYSIRLGNHLNVTAEQRVHDLKERLIAGDFVAHRDLADGRVIKVIYRSMRHGGWVALHEDVTEKRRAEEHIAHLAHHDSLTNLPNRALFRQRLEDDLVRVRAGRERLALICLDLDHFKSVNDTLGHPTGDRLLCCVTQRLRDAVGAHDMVARLGGDEFAILLREGDREAAQELAKRLIEVIDAPFQIEGHTINSGVSVGVAIAPDDGDAVDELMKRADLALYRAKSSGCSAYRFYESEMGARVETRRELELDLRQALAAGDFELVFQPQVRAANQALTGFEALLRWRRQNGDVVSPAEFIPLAEETGLINPIGEWVLRRACAEAAHWPDPIRIAVNMSPIQFRNRELPILVMNALAASGLPPRRLEIEITEAALMTHDAATIAILHELRGLGVRISMDDFGVGYSSLSYLRSFPFDKIKIDRSFVADLDRNKDNATIIRAVASLGASLNIETTAEGVETAEQLAIVRECGCSEIQGHLVSRPRSAAGVHELIARLTPRVDAA